MSGTDYPFLLLTPCSCLLLNARPIMLAHRTVPAGSIVENTSVESIQILANQIKEPGKMLV